MNEGKVGHGIAWFPGHCDVRQHGDELLFTPGFMGRDEEATAQLGFPFIDRHSGPVSGEFGEDAARLAH